MVDRQDSTSAASGLEDFMTAGQCACVRGGCLARSLCATSFQNDNRSAQGDFPGGGEERPRISDGLHIDDDARGLRVAPQVVEQITPADIHHRAYRDKGTEPNVLVQTPIQHSGAEGPTLANEGDMAGAGHVAGKGGIETGQRVHHTKAVGSDDS